ncbi:MAG TPA: formate dehydrogenase accessory sulfurtransferase FdhD [Gammaproteobacteria bacterium]|nr:formate dehydrogenase accessory sulfurtransferase FdhD [Gammaproteobacteria bacterium]
MPRTQERYQPEITHAGLTPTHPVSVVDEFNETREVEIPGESPLTLYVDEREIVTLMTIGAHPEALALGYLRNQRFVDDLEQIKSVNVDHRTESVRVTTWKGIDGWDEKLRKRTVTTGCGQGTVFSCTLDSLYTVKLPTVTLRQSTIYALLDNVTDCNGIYKRAGAVHGCGLCQGSEILMYTEDVGRHNAADAISGYMWLDAIGGEDKVFYTTGRLTSEIVMKSAHMGIAVLLSRSGVTHMGLELAQELGITMIARAKGKHFLVYSGASNIIFDAQPEQRQPKPDR